MNLDFLLFVNSVGIVVKQVCSAQNCCNFAKSFQINQELQIHRAVDGTAYYLITITYQHSDLQSDRAMDCFVLHAIDAECDLDELVIVQTVS